jgi:hypothetical protein
MGTVFPFLLLSFCFLYITSWHNTPMRNTSFHVIRTVHHDIFWQFYYVVFCLINHKPYTQNVFDLKWECFLQLFPKYFSLQWIRIASFCRTQRTDVCRRSHRVPCIFNLCTRWRWGTRWCGWLRHCATSRKVAGSIPDVVIGIFHWRNPPDRTIALGLIQPLEELSTRNISWG